MMEPPIAKKVDKKLTIHGEERTDPYYWMNQRENPEVIAYLEAENEYTRTVMEPTEALQENLFSEMVGRIRKDDRSVPYRRNGYFYYIRYEEEKEYPIYCRLKDSPGAKEKVLLDVNILAAGHEYFHVAGLEVSEDNRILAYTADSVGRRIYSIYFRDLVSGESLGDLIPRSGPDLAWANDNSSLFYVQKDETLRPYEVWMHSLGTDPEKDVMVYRESDPTFRVSVFKTRSRKHIMIASGSTLSDEYRYLDADDPSGKFSVVQSRLPRLEYSVSHFKDSFYILTNYQAKNFRLMVAPVINSSKDHWEEVVPHRETVLLEDFTVFNDFIALKERENGISDIRIIYPDGTSHRIEFDEPSYVVDLENNPESDSKRLRISYTSLRTPNSVFDYDVRNHDLQLLKRQEVVGNFDREDYETDRFMVPATDGELIPISLVRRKGKKKDSGTPLLLYGYGSYGYSIDPVFNSARLSLLDRGFIFAIAHIRGGEEKGRDWYEKGKLLNKMNTFTDFIDCAIYLVDKGYTDPSHLYAMGGSAGGLLIGAVVNMKHDLFAGVIAAVPFVDLVTTMLDDSIPLTTGEYDEWGNPNLREYYDYMLSYSPYDNVRHADYPAMLVTAGIHDSQVQYWEPAKWVARLRVMKTDKNPLLLKTNMDYGHSGASGRYERYRELALEYAFLLELSGIRE